MLWADGSLHAGRLFCYQMRDNIVRPVVKNETISSDSKWINSTIDGSIDENTPVNLKDDFYTVINKDWLLEPLGKGEEAYSPYTGIQEQFDENHRRVCACVENIVRGMNA